MRQFPELYKLFTWPLFISLNIFTPSAKCYLWTLSSINNLHNYFFSLKGLIQESEPDVFVLVDDEEIPDSKNTTNVNGGTSISQAPSTSICIEDESESVLASAQDQRQEELQVRNFVVFPIESSCRKYIETMEGNKIKGRLIRVWNYGWKEWNTFGMFDAKMGLKLVKKEANMYLLT